MKRFSTLLLSVIMLIGCSQPVTNDLSCEKTLAQSTNQESGKRLSQKETKDNKEIDWSKIVRCDGYGAWGGVGLASKSKNPWVVLCTALGIGTYKSVEEYDRQKDNLDSTKTSVGNTLAIYNNPEEVNPFHPVLPYSSYQQYSLKDSIARFVGEGHNFLVREVLSMYPTNQMSKEEKFSAIIKLCEEKYSTFLDLDYNRVAEELSHTDNDNELFTKYCTMYSPFDLEKLKLLTDEYLEECQSSARDFAGIATLYYSNLLWNRLAPNPYTATECVIWNSESKSCDFLTEQDKIKSVYKSQTYLVLFPSYDKKEAAVLYFYTEDTDKVVDFIEISEDYKIKSSTYPQEIINIRSGKHPVMETDIYNIYYISLK